MHIVCDKQTLLNAINIVSKSVAVRTTNDILYCYLIVADRDGLSFFSNNSEMSIELRGIEAEIYTKGAVVVNANLFNSIINAASNEEITIKADAKNVCHITFGKSAFKINGFSQELFPKPLTVMNNDNTVVINSKMLKTMINETIFSVSTQDNRPVLKGELLKIDEGCLNVVAIDGFRVSCRKFFGDYKGYSEMGVPAEALNGLSRFLPDDADVKIDHSSRTVSFEFENCKVVTNLIDGNYISYENLFKTDSPIEVVVSKDDMYNAIERVMIMSKNIKAFAVNLKIKDSNINMSVISDMGNVDEDVQIKSEKFSEDLNITFNLKYFEDIFKNVKDEYLKMYFNTNKSPCFVTPLEGDHFKYMVLPINPKT